MQFKLFSKLASLEGAELYLLIGALVAFAVLLTAALAGRKAAKDGAARQTDRTRILVYGALCLTLSFVLSYFKLFSMPFGGSITLVSMLPLAMYACAFGPAFGFTAAIAYAILQIIQGAYIVHWAQFILDYFVAFACIGFASFFPKRLPLGMAVAGFSRMLVSIVSGAIFFADGGLDYGIANPWVYSAAYNGLTIGVDTVLCVIVSLLPPVRRVFNRL